MLKIVKLWAAECAL